VGERDQALDGAFLSLEDGFDGAVPVVTHPTTDVVLLRQPPRGVAEEDALDAAVDDHSLAHLESRLSAVPYRIEIDLFTCVGFAECAKTAPGVFRLDEFANQSTVVDDRGDSDDTILGAAEACPVSAISLYDAATGERVFGTD
jgi:ferredoxin